MQINLKPIKVKDVFDQFVDNGEDGVFGYHGAAPPRIVTMTKWQKEGEILRYGL